MALAGQKTVTTAGTRVTLVAASQKVNAAVAIKALAANTGKIYVGDVSVSSSVGFELSAKEVVVFALIGDLLEIYIDSSVNGEGVSWCVLEV